MSDTPLIATWTSDRLDGLHVQLSLDSGSQIAERSVKGEGMVQFKPFLERECKKLGLSLNDITHHLMFPASFYGEKHDTAVLKRNGFGGPIIFFLQPPTPPERQGD